SPKLTRPIGVIYKHRKVFSAQTTRFIEMLGGALVNSDASFSPPTAAPTPESLAETPKEAD
ncbi:MAG: hypothetical protein IJO46_11935, partial [Thermoguttaceae bacterium]|nr:hypothetical protein [Thermoguttaceae bacterium]